MKIVLISNYRPDAQQSMLRYPEMLRRVLTNCGHTVRVVHPPAVLGHRLHNTIFGVGKWIAYMDKYVLAFPWLRWQCRGADLIHICDHSNAMYLDYVTRIPRVVTCHDVLQVKAARGEQPGRSVGTMGQRQQRWILNSLRKAPYIICASRKTAADLLDLAPEVRNRVRVIHHSLNWSEPPSRKRDTQELLARMNAQPGTPYFLHVGGNQWYKNRLGAIKVFAAIRKLPEFRGTQFVMAGGPFSEDMLQFTRSAGLQGVVIESGRVSDPELQSLYQGAQALIFPSLEEGFGWPILEAQACGCVVITTNRPPMTEIAGGAAILIDPEEPEDAARIVAEHWPNREALRAQGSKNVAEHSPEKVGRAYCEAYQEVVSLSKDTSRASASFLQHPQ